MAGREMMRATHMALLFAAALAAPAFAANPPNALDLPPSGVTPPPVDMLQTGPVQQSTSERPRELSGNPLWAIPLSSLSATRERPLFTPSRRPPAPAIAGPPPAEPIAKPVAPPPGPDRPQLTLVGAVIGSGGGIAIFVDQATNDVVRLKTGESHSGWMLRSVKGREALFQKNSETLTLALPVPGEPAPGTVPAPGTAPAPNLVPPPGMALPPGSPPRIPPPPGKEPEL
jgi:general secretion pathway protein N